METLPFLAPIAADLRRVDEVIGARLESDVPLVRRVAEYIVAGGGKRLRPAVMLLAAGASGYCGDARFELAAVVEFIHTATLLHDDVVDESGLRRGRKTANAAFGNAASVLVGDFLYSRAFQMMLAVDDVLDYPGDLHETGKNLGDDLNEGKPTLPLIYAMRKGSPAQAQTVRHAIERGGRDDFEAVLEAITNTGALDYARGQARGEAAPGCAAIQ